MTTLTKIDCPKCSGHKRIDSFSHVANGVCFCCNGVGTVDIDLDANRAQLCDLSRELAEWVLSATDEEFARLSFSTLSKIRTFCHGGWGLGEAYPTLYSHWSENGHGIWAAKQDEQLALWYAENPV